MKARGAPLPRAEHIEVVDLISMPHDRHMICRLTRLAAITQWLTALQLAALPGLWTVEARSAGTNEGDDALGEILINNEDCRRDQTGEIVDAHDGCLQFFNGRYYLFGTAYGTSSGFSINNRFRVYSSADLMDWVFEGELLKEPPDGVYYRPYVVLNPKTRKKKDPNPLKIDPCSSKPIDPSRFDGL